MDGLLEMGGAWLARAFAFCGLALAAASFFFITVILLRIVA